MLLRGDIRRLWISGSPFSDAHTLPAGSASSLDDGERSSGHCFLRVLPGWGRAGSPSPPYPAHLHAGLRNMGEISQCCYTQLAITSHCFPVRICLFSNCSSCSLATSKEIVPPNVAN